MPARVSIYTTKCLLSAWKACRARSRKTLQILATLSSAPGVSVQSRWPQIHWAKPLIEPQLLADKVNLPPYALPWKTHHSVCTTVGERHSPQAVTHRCFSNRTSPRRAIHSNLIKVDSGRASSDFSSSYSFHNNNVCLYFSLACICCLLNLHKLVLFHSFNNHSEVSELFLDPDED